MKISHDSLMAYADGELDADSRTAVAQAVAADPALAAQVAAHQALRQRISTAFSADLTEPVPARLQAALQAPATAQVVDLAARRAAQAAQSAPAAPDRAGNAAHWGWRAWGGLAAGLMVGVLVGRLGLPANGQAADPGAAALLANAALAQALGEQLAAALPAAGPVAVRLSFVDHYGRYCRAFELPGQAGLACRSGETWAVQALVARVATPAAADAALRQAASPLPPALLSEIDQRIAGDPLSASAEVQARSQGWRR